ncbi:MAG: HEAT repeat domain-containing protein [Pirellulaceae bacterium]
MKTHDHLRVQLVAAEPSVRDPVAIDFGFDGDLWVAQMSDYGRGVYESFKTSGEVRRLKDADHDGHFETATTFVSGLRFPTDVKVWRDGVLICDAPDILFARDTDQDGVADDVKKLFSGFEVRNAQARVNSLRWGLDNWLYGSCGLFGGEIVSHLTGQTVDLTGRDFRLNPDSGAIEAVSGRTQQGRCRNDWGDWFGCSNGSLLRHYAGDEAYDGRNPFVTASVPPGLVGDAVAYRLYPPEQLVQFELSGAPGAATSACGLGIYRDDRLGPEFSNNAFTCEPVHQSVHRIVLRENGLNFEVSRGEGEADSEFLSSSDRWFRPVQVRTGPDGGLWIVDMYRFVIEHSRWIPQATLAKLDIYAGQSMGRIYRVVPHAVGEQPAATDSQSPSDLRSSPILPLDFTAISNQQCVDQLQSRNGTIRDLAHQWLLYKTPDAELIEQVMRLVRSSEAPPITKVHALAVLDGWDQLDDETLLAAIEQSDPEVVRWAMRIGEAKINQNETLRDASLSMASHKSPRLRRQIAWSLGSLESNASTTSVLASLAATTQSDPYVRAAAISSLHQANVARVLEAYLALPADQQQSDILKKLIRSAVRMLPSSEVGSVATRLFDGPSVSNQATKNRDASVPLLVELLDAADARGDGDALAFEPAFAAWVLELHRQAAEAVSVTNLNLLGRYRGKATTRLLQQAIDLRSTNDSENSSATRSIANVVDEVSIGRAIAELLSAKHPTSTQVSAVEALARTRHSGVPELLLGAYNDVSVPARDAIRDALLSRNDWTTSLLRETIAGKIRPTAFDADRRNRLLTHADATIRHLATEAFRSTGTADRKEVIERFRSALTLTGDQQHGREVYRKHCAACHRLDDYGQTVGPNLAALTNRDPEWLLTAMMDPNRDVDARYISWSALTEDGRVISGLIVDENAASVTVCESGGKKHELLRGTLEQLRSTNRSLMPEGLEKDLSPQDVANLIAYVTHHLSPLEPSGAMQTLPRRAPEIAPFLLDERESSERRQQAIDQRPGMGPAIVSLLANDSGSGDDATQQLRLDWIERTARAIGLRNDGGEIRDLLEVALPSEDETLVQWQSVAISGVIDGLSQAKQWPAERIANVLLGAASLRPQWRSMLTEAASMIDDSRLTTGVRGDAMRIVALAEPDQAIERLRPYLSTNVDDGLRWRAISGFSDIDSPEACEQLIQALPNFQSKNRELTLAALFRMREHAVALQAAHRDDAHLLSDQESERLRRVLEKSKTSPPQ